MSRALHLTEQLISRRSVTPEDGGRSAARSGAVKRSRGQSAAEVLVVVALLSLALTIGPESPLEQVFRAFADRYARFSYAISRP